MSQWFFGISLFLNVLMSSYPKAELLENIGYLCPPHTVDVYFGS